MIPKFISFEGGEGGGKSTQVKLLKTALENYGVKVVTTREPGGTESAEAIRNILVNGKTDSLSNISELLLHLAARAEHVEKFIKPELAAGNFVLCDRFTDSTIAYQAFGHRLGYNFVRQFCNLSIGNFWPNLTIMLDIAVESGILRAHKRQSAENRYEKMGNDFHQRVRSGFLAIAENEKSRCVIINAEDGVNIVHRNIIKAVRDSLELDLEAVC